MAGALRSVDGAPKFPTRLVAREWVGKRSVGRSGPSTDEPRERSFQSSFSIVTCVTQPKSFRLQQRRRRPSMPNWRRLYLNTHRANSLAVELVQETAGFAARIIDRLVAGGTSTISLIGGLAEPLAPWLPSRVKQFLVLPQSDPLDGAILMARRAFESRREAPEILRISAA